jgi:phospholipid/cholesterol/gamma-HCH transport system ATP-binding protein
MSEEKDEATIAREQLDGDGIGPALPPRIMPQLEPSPGLPARRAVQRHRARILSMWDTLPASAREAIRTGLSPVTPVQGEPA